jgi:hypothetical protein
MAMPGLSRTCEAKLSGDIAMPTPMRPRPTAATRSLGGRTISGAAGPEAAMTATPTGSSVAAASSGVRPSVPCRYRVTRVAAPLVAAVLTKGPSGCATQLW